MNNPYRLIAAGIQESNYAVFAAWAAYAEGHVPVRVVTLCEVARDADVESARKSGLLLVLVPMVLS